MIIRTGTRNLENLFKPPNPFAPKAEEEYQAKLDARNRFPVLVDHLRIGERSGGRADQDRRGGVRRSELRARGSR
jgi:hypothetical protein